MLLRGKERFSLERAPSTNPVEPPTGQRRSETLELFTRTKLLWGVSWLLEGFSIRWQASHLPVGGRTGVSSRCLPTGTSCLSCTATPATL